MGKHRASPTRKLRHCKRGHETLMTKIILGMHVSARVIYSHVDESNHQNQNVKEHCCDVITMQSKSLGAQSYCAAEKFFKILFNSNFFRPRAIVHT